MVFPFSVPSDAPDSAAAERVPLTSLLAMGVLVALGVLLETLLVRTLPVPAPALGIGPALWWPSHLGRHRPIAESGEPALEPSGAATHR